MKKVYIVLTHTGTILSKAIRIIKKHEYTHVSISLDECLEQMYSFGRIRPYIAFIGGFVHESPQHGTFKRFPKTKTKIFYIEVTDKQYEKIKKLIKHFTRKKRYYRFNTLGLLSAAINKKITKENKFYCAEFIKYILEKSKIKNNLPEIVTPEDFLHLENISPIYIGTLKEYPN